MAMLTERALEKSLQSVEPGEIAPGKYTAILEPAAVVDLLAYLWSDFTGTSHIDQLSWELTDKVGKKVFDQRINIVDDAQHPLSTGCPFDGEGISRQRVALVTNGVLKNLVHGRRSANSFGLAPTGHGLGEPSPVGEYPLNLIVESDQNTKATVADMIASVGPGQRAVLLTRAWYVREVDPSTKLLTGMTRDGTFLVEDGKVVKALKNLRFNVSVLDLLNNVLVLGQPVVTAGAEGFPPAVIPPLMVKDFNFTEVTQVLITDLLTPQPTFDGGALWHPNPNQGGIDIVFGAGGGKGPGEIGAYKALLELRVPIGTITGVSVGNLLAVMATNGMSPDAMAAEKLFAACVSATIPLSFSKPSLPAIRLASWWEARSTSLSPCGKWSSVLGSSPTIVCKSLPATTSVASPSFLPARTTIWPRP